MEALAAHCRLIPDEAIAAEVQNHPSQTPESAWAAAAEALAVKALLLAEADRLGVTAGPVKDAAGRDLAPDDARIEALIEQEVVTPKADEQTCRRYYRRHLERFSSPDLVEASHILFAVPATDSGRYARAIAQAEETIAELSTHPERFAALAAERSACPSRDQGGNLGQVGPGQTVSEFEAVLFELEPGQLCPEPVETRYGAHVVKAGRRIAGQTLPFEYVRDRIAGYLEEASWRRAVAQYISLLASTNPSASEQAPSPSP
ncbi:MAG: peptidylprolyl isomerase [Gammaproteobacteria bacterium]|nr:peptidylprolyl isomerase [Gammaproteobacteria bacterium]MDH3506997.1 peptidylprolyl isomerase [Gammaproteobacteria bacterium]